MGNYANQPASDAAFRCIAIETATANGSVAVSDGENVFTVKLGIEKDSSRQIFGAIREALSRAAMVQASITCVAFGNGPGSFTGVRVATSAAQSLGFTLQVPVVAVSTLAAVAIEAGRTRGAEPIAVCLDARMGEAYVGLYRFDAAGLAVPLLADALVDPDTFALTAASGRVMAAGPGWSVYPQMLENNKDRISDVATDIWPGAAAIAVEAQELHRQGRVMAPHEALPNYVRNKVTHQRT